MPAKREPNALIQTPAGIEIAYYDSIGVDGKPQQRRYLYDGKKLVSVSTIANIFDKPALPSWAGKKNVLGVKTLIEAGIAVECMELDEVLYMLRKQGLHHDSIRDAAAERGTAAHDALVHLLGEGKVPNPATFPEDQRGYIRAGVRWFMEARPEIIDAETIVASVEYGFAGRYDLHAKFPDGRTGRIDAKTLTEWHYKKGKDGPTEEKLPPYMEHFSQVEGYELAARESGYGASDFRAVLRLGPDGEYDLTESHLSPEHFLGDLAAYRNRQDAARVQREGAKAVAA